LREREGKAEERGRKKQQGEKERIESYAEKIPGSERKGGAGAGGDLVLLTIERRLIPVGRKRFERGEKIRRTDLDSMKKTRFGTFHNHGN